MSVYDNVNCKELGRFAKEAGLGGKIPVDFLQFKKYLKRGDKILEVGCGTGRIGRRLVKNYKYIGVDRHGPYLDCFKKYLIKNKIKNIGDMLIYSSFESYHGSNFDIIIFPWTVIGDFAKNKQMKMIKKAKNLLKDGGLILIDNPAKGTKYNIEKSYNPCRFYYNNWERKLLKIFNDVNQVLYDTPAGRIRELTILKK